MKEGLPESRCCIMYLHASVRISELTLIAFLTPEPQRVREKLFSRAVVVGVSYSRGETPLSKTERRRMPDLAAQDCQGLPPGTEWFISSQAHSELRHEGTRRLFFRNPLGFLQDKIKVFLLSCYKRFVCAGPFYPR